MSRLAAVLASAAFASVAALPAAPAEASCHDSRLCVCFEETRIPMPYLDPFCVWVEVAGSGRLVCV